MPRKRRRIRRDDTLTRTAEISSFSAAVRLHVEHPKDPEPQIEAKPWLELRGTLNEPVRDVSAVAFSVYPEARTTVGTARPPSVASIIQVRPEVRVVGSCPHAEFDRIWAFALSGHLKHAHIYFTKPHYGTALVMSLSFSSEPEE